MHFHLPHLNPYPVFPPHSRPHLPSLPSSAPSTPLSPSPHPSTTHAMGAINQTRARHRKTVHRQILMFLRPGPSSFFDPRRFFCRRVPRQMGKTVHKIGGLACILGLTNLHNQSPSLPRNVAPREWCPPTRVQKATSS